MLRARNAFWLLEFFYMLLHYAGAYPTYQHPFKAKPEVGGRVEILRKPKSRIRSNGPFPENDFVDPDPGNADGGGKLLLGHCQRLKEFISEYFPRWGRPSVFGQHGTSH